jgi:WD40 repeat protein
LIASGDIKGRLIVWHGETGEQLTREIIKAHSKWITSLDFSPDGTVLATGSADHTIKLWDTTTWQMQGDAIQCGGGDSISYCTCVRYSPSSKLLAIAIYQDIKILNSGTRECVAEFKGHVQNSFSLAWTPDGTRLLTGGDKDDPTIREWDASTWQQVGDPWMGHSRPESINFIAVHPDSNLVASAAYNRLLLWRLSDRHTIAIFQHSGHVKCVTFSMDGKHILSGGDDKMISEWEVPKKVLSQETLTEPAPKVLSLISCARLLPHLASKAQIPNLKACFHLSLC